jgi:hypothetical protein
MGIKIVCVRLDAAAAAKLARLARESERTRSGVIRWLIRKARTGPPPPENNTPPGELAGPAQGPKVHHRAIGGRTP